MKEELGNLKMYSDLPESCTNNLTMQQFNNFIDIRNQGIKL
ncbi:hypothetical protein L1278_002883 [Pontibacter sp. HSC-36F09]|nr:hypothetical protein [Pontibacter sp. HSC-36F09]